MLEEGLRSTTFPPAEVAQGLSSFIENELTDGGSTAEKRFIGLFSLLCDRLFGPLGGSKEDFRHEAGGWLARQNRWEIPRSTSGSSSASATHLASPSSLMRSAHGASEASSLDNDPVVQLLCGSESLKTKNKVPTFLEAISGKTEARRGVRVQYPFFALPKATQEILMKMVQSVIDGIPLSKEESDSRNNAIRLFEDLIRVPLKEQTELHNLHLTKNKTQETKSRPLSFSPGAPPPLFSPIQNSKKDDSTAAKKNVLETPQIMLTMVEFYLLTFLRYPLATPLPTTPAPQGHSSTRTVGQTGMSMQQNRSTPYGELVYVNLFRCYLLHFLPHNEQAQLYVGFRSLSSEQELFLRIVIELWLTMKLTPLQTSAQALLERRQKHAAPATSTSAALLDLDSAFDLVKVVYEPPPSVLQKCLKSLVAHALKDPLVIAAIMDCSETKPKALPWCLSPTMTALQQAFYNYILVSFRHAPIHTSSSPFYAALDMWLWWLEPWNIEIRKKHAPTDFSKPGTVLASTVSHMAHNTQAQMQTIHVLRTMKATARSKYTEKWEPFVAANLYLYTVPLALFLRRARELDFSSRYFASSFAILQRVFRVYSPSFMASVNRLLDEGDQHVLASLVGTHKQALGAFSPGLVGPIHMKSLENDMRNLLEEVYLQYFKTVRERGFFDRLEASIEGFFSYIGLAEPTTGEERKIQLLVEKAKLMVGLPVDYQISVKGASSRLASTNGIAGTVPRLNGFLTELGKARVISGEITFRPSDIVLPRPTVHSPVKSHEIRWLVTLTILASEYLNSKLGLVGEGKESLTHTVGLRINLRFLADYRNLLFIAIVLWIWARFL